MTLLTILLLSGCSLQVGLEQRVAQGRAEGEGKAAPALVGEAVEGGRVSLADARGHPVVIDFWASWCGPCRAEQPQLNAMAGRLTPRGVRFIGVDFRDDRAQARAYIDDFKVPYLSLFDPYSTTAAQWDIAAPPTVIVVDGRGRIRARFLGTLNGVETLVDTLVAEQSRRPR